MDWTRSFDWLALEAVAALNGGGAVALVLTRGVGVLLSADTVKMGPPVLLLLYAWLRRGSVVAGRGVLAAPEVVVRGTLGSLLALAAGRPSCGPRSFPG